MRRISLAFILFVVCLIQSMAQEFIPNRFYAFNLKTVNPAYTAISEGQSLTMMGMGAVESRTKDIVQSSNIISYERNVKKINSGIGLQFLNYSSTVDVIRTIGLLYRYRIKLSDRSGLLLGTNIKASGIKTFYATYLGNNLVSKTPMKPDVDFGASYMYGKFHVGLSVNHAIATNYLVDNVYNRYYKYNPVLNITLGNKFIVTKWLSLEPLLLYKWATQGNSYPYRELGLNLQTIWLDRMVLGGGYSSHAINNRNTYSTYFGNIGVVILKKLEIVSLFYSGERYRLLYGFYSPVRNFNYEFVIRMKI